MVMMNLVLVFPLAHRCALGPTGKQTSGRKQEEMVILTAVSVAYIPILTF
jgi:hypothetical protein